LNWLGSGMVDERGFGRVDERLFSHESGGLNIGLSMVSGFGIPDWT
jgi:hypothetical protein